MIYTFYTDSHKVFLDDWFMKTLHEEEQDLVHVEKFDQECHSGSFMQEGWNKTMLRKVDYIRDCLEGDDVFIHADCDIQFFDKFYDDMKKEFDENEYDILGQHDGKLWHTDTMCAGFFMARPNDKTRSLFEEVRYMVASGNAGNDQLALNALLHANKHDVKYGLLDDSFYSVWRTNGIKEWTPNDPVSIPENILMHHSNYTSGIPNKIKLMEIIREQYNART